MSPAPPSRAKWFQPWWLFPGRSSDSWATYFSLLPSFLSEASVSCEVRSQLPLRDSPGFTPGSLFNAPAKGRTLEDSSLADRLPRRDLGQLKREHSPALRAHQLFAHRPAAHHVHRRRIALHTRHRRIGRLGHRLRRSHIRKFRASRARHRFERRVTIPANMIEATVRRTAIRNLRTTALRTRNRQLPRRGHRSSTCPKHVRLGRPLRLPVLAHVEFAR